MEKTNESYVKYFEDNNLEYYRCINHKSKKCTSKMTKNKQGEITRKTGHKSACLNLKSLKRKFVQDTSTNLKKIKNPEGKKSWQVPKYDKELHFNLKNSIINAFKRKEMKFNDELVIDENVNIPKDYLQSIQSLSRVDVQTFLNFKKEYSSNMYYGPLEIQWNINQGYVIKATAPIKKYTLLCEYTGEVIHKTEDFYSDDLMGYAAFDDKDYVIYPGKQGNIARFMSGINNVTGKDKQNVQSIKFKIGEKIHIALYTIKQVKEGELLYYDYNQGSTLKDLEMPTSNYN
jgi:hypothetical protein